MYITMSLDLCSISICSMEKLKMIPPLCAHIKSHVFSIVHLMGMGFDHASKVDKLGGCIVLNIYEYM